MNPVSARRLLNWPARYRLVDLSHEPDGFLQGHNHLLIVHEVVEGELPAPAVLQPLLTNLVAAHMEFPDFFGNAFEVLGLVDVNIARLAFLVGNELGEASTK
jgi:hypothetical protein